nr:MAG: internal scaffolding protein [Microvirus sp.]
MSNIQSYYVREKMPGLKFDQEERMTQQQFKDDVDINNIVSRFLQTGYINPMLVKNGVPEYGDVTKIESYKDSMDKIKDAEQMFMQLPARIRARFQHDPLELLAFVADKKNLPEAVELGLVEPPAHLPLDVNVPSDTLKKEVK